MAILLLSLIYHPDGGNYAASLTIPEIRDSVELWELFAHGIPEYMSEIALSLLPIILFFAVFQILVLKLPRRQLLKILAGLVYTYIGLVLFLTGVNVGFLPAGNYLGNVMGSSSYPWLLVPVAMILGFFIVRAEPAVYVLNKQVEEITDGAISEKSMGMALSAGVAFSLGIAMIRVLTGISIMWFIIPGYAIAIGISFFVPKIYTAIAFDSGGVASGPMTAAFLLPLAQGACAAVGGNMVTDAFGVVAMVAMTPLITIQIMGICARVKSRITAGKEKAADAAYGLELLEDEEIIEL